MLQVIGQTDKQKLKMYMKLKKKELAKMLIQCNKILDAKPMEYYQFDGSMARTQSKINT